MSKSLQVIEKRKKTTKQTTEKNPQKKPNKHRRLITVKKGSLPKKSV